MIEASRVRFARQDDVRSIAEVHAASWKETYSGIVPESFLASIDVARLEARWEHNLPEDGRRTYVAEDPPGHVVGFAIGGPGEGGDPTFTAELGAIYILRAAQGRGLGRRLVDALVRDLVADGHRSMLVWVLAKNPHRGFYEALGGEPVRHRVREHGGTPLEEVAYGWSSLNSGLLGEDRPKAHSTERSPSVDRSERPSP